MVKPLIVGLDIGATSAVAIFDLNRNLLSVRSKKNFPMPEIVNEIIRYGKPLIIATDKKKAPPTIAKLAASFNCRLFTPDHDLGVEEKESIINVSLNNSHERDALAAAVYANKTYFGLFANIDKTLQSMNLSDMSDNVKEMIIKKEAKNIADAIEKLKPKPKEEEIKLTERNVDWKNKAEELRRKLLDLQKSYDILKLYSQKLEERIKTLEVQKEALITEELKKNEDTRKEVIREKEIKSRDILIKQLQFEIERLKNFSKTHKKFAEREMELKEIREKDLIPVIIIKEFDKDSIVYAHKEYGLKDQIVWIKNPKHSKTALKALVSFQPRIVIADLDEDMKNSLVDSGIIVLNELKPETKKYYGIIAKSELESIVKNTEKKNFINWLNEYKKH